MPGGSLGPAGIADFEKRLVLCASSCAGARCFGLVKALQPGVQIRFGLRPGYAVALLQLPEELVFFTADDL